MHKMMLVLVTACLVGRAVPAAAIPTALNLSVTPLPPACAGEVGIRVTTDSTITFSQFFVEYDSTCVEFVGANLGSGVSGFQVTDLVVAPRLPVRPVNPEMNRTLVLQLSNAAATYAGTDVEVVKLRFQALAADGRSSGLMWDQSTPIGLPHTVLTTNHGVDLRPPQLEFHDATIEPVAACFHSWSFFEGFDGFFAQAWDTSNRFPAEPNVTNDAEPLSLGFSPLGDGQSLHMRNLFNAPLLRRGLLSVSTVSGPCGVVEARINTLAQGGRATSSNIDGLADLWLISASDNRRFVHVGLFSGNFGDVRVVYFNSSFPEGGDNAPFAYANNTWYRLRISATDTAVRVAIWDDAGSAELAFHEYPHSLSDLGQTFRIGISQHMGNPGYWPFYTEGAVDYIAAVGIPACGVTDANDGGGAHVSHGMLRLEQNAPNPFNPTTEIRFFVPTDGRYRCFIYDAMGRQVREVFDCLLSRGPGAAVWDGRTNGGARASSGAYLYSIEDTGGKQEWRKMILLK
jgi:hypothetical protein